MNEGRLVFNEMKESLANKYMMVKGNKELLDRDVRKWFIGLRETEVGFEGLLNNRSEGNTSLEIMPYAKHLPWKKSCILR